MEKKKFSGCNRKKGSSRCLTLANRAVAKELRNIKTTKICCPGYKKGMCISRRNYGESHPNNYEELAMPMAL